MIVAFYVCFDPHVADLKKGDQKFAMMIEEARAKMVIRPFPTSQDVINFVFISSLIVDQIRFSQIRLQSVFESDLWPSARQTAVLPSKHFLQASEPS